MNQQKGFKVIRPLVKSISFFVPILEEKITSVITMGKMIEAEHLGSER